MDTEEYMSSTTKSHASEKLDRLKARRVSSTDHEDLIKAHASNTASLELEERLEEATIHNAQLEGANQHLRHRLQEALSELQETKLQLDIQTTLAAPSNQSDFLQTPTRSVTSAQAQAEQEARDARVLGLLRAKDEALEGLEARCAEATSEVGHLKSQIVSVTRRLETNQIRLDELLEANSKLTREADEREASHQASVARLTAENEGLKAELSSQKSIVEEQNHAVQELATAKVQLQSLSNAAQAADVLVEDLHKELNVKELQLAEQDKAITRYQSYIEHLLGVSAPIEDLSMAAISSGIDEDAGNEPSDSNSDTMKRVKHLEAVNATLEKALVAVNARLASLTSSSSVVAENDTAVQEARDGPDGSVFCTLLARIGDLQERLAAREASENETKLELTSALDREGRAHEALERRLVEIEQLQTAKDDLENCVTEVSRQLAGRDEENTQLQQKLEKTAAGKKAAETALNGAKDALEAATQALTKARQDGEAKKTEIAALKDRVKACEQDIQQRQQTCNELTNQVASLNAAVDSLTTERDAAIADASEASRRHSNAHVQLVDALEENVKLTELVCELEQRCGAASAQLSAQEAAGSLLRQWSEDGGMFSSELWNGDVDVVKLARGLQAETLAKLEIHQEAETLKIANFALERRGCQLQTIIHRLNNAIKLAGGIVIHESNNNGAITTVVTDSSQQQASSEVVQNIEKLEVELATVRADLTKALGAQHGQAACFAALASRAQVKERKLTAEVEEMRAALEASQSARGACRTVSAALKSALVSVGEKITTSSSSAIKDTTKQNASSSAKKKELQTVISIAEQAADLIQHQANTIARLQNSIQASGSEATLVDDSQRAVIRCLSAQLAQQALNTSPSNASPNNTTTTSRKAQTSPLNVHHHKNASVLGELNGLCALLLTQLASVRGMVDHPSSKMADLAADLGAMDATLRVLRSEVDSLSTLNVGSSFKNINSSSSTQPPARVDNLHNMASHAYHNNASAVSRNGVDPEAYEMAGKVAMLSRRLALLTSAHEAAKEEADHARQAAAELSNALSLTQQAQREDAEKAEQREQKLKRRLRAAREEVKGLMGLLEKMDKEWKEWERGVGVAIQDLQRRLRDKHHKGQHLPPAGLAALLDGLDAIVQEAHAIGERVSGLEEKATAATMKQQKESSDAQKQALLEERWACFARFALRLRAVVDAVHRQKQEDIDNVVARQAKHQSELESALQVAHEECERLRLRLEAIKEAGEEQLRKQAELQVAQLSEVENATKERLREAHRKAADTTERRVRFELSSVVDEARDGVAEAQRACAVLKAERDAILSEFNRFKEVKYAEIKLLEHRLGLTNSASNATTTSGAATPASEQHRAAAAGQIAAACRSDAVAAALREARLEASSRRKLEQELETQREAAKQAKLEAKAAHKEAIELRKRVKELTASAHVGSSEVESVKQELAASRVEAQRYLSEVYRLRALLRQQPSVAQQQLPNTSNDTTTTTMEEGDDVANDVLAAGDAVRGMTKELQQAEEQLREWDEYQKKYGSGSQ